MGRAEQKESREKFVKRKHRVIRKTRGRCG